MNIWRLQTNTAGGNIGFYCLDKNAACMGWSLTDDEVGLSEKERSNINSIEDFYQLAEKHPNPNYNVNSVRRLYRDVKPNDLIWMRVNGLYYLGRVGEKSIWKFDASKEASDFDASNQRTDIEWLVLKDSDESSIPGTIRTAFIRGQTIQRIRAEGIVKYSQFLYNKHTNTNTYDVNKEHKSDEERMTIFYNYLSTDESEDLLCMWLFSEFGYITIPSTSKNETQLYECVLLNPKNGNNIYVQVKKGYDDIDGDNYKHLNGEVWLFTTRGKTKNLCRNIKSVNPSVLYDFAFSIKSINLLPKGILSWVAHMNLYFT